MINIFLLSTNIFQQQTNSMRRNYRSHFQYQKQKYNKNEMEGKQMLKQRCNQGVELKSLQCSSVIEVQPTNQSYENSWLQKLVNNIDQDKPTNKGNELFARNLNRKYCHDAKANESASKRLGTQNMKAPYYSASKTQNRSPITILEDKKHQFVKQCSRFNAFQQQRTPQVCVKKLQFTIERPNDRLKQNSQSYEKQMNESSKSYGKIKRYNKSIQAKAQIAEGKKNTNGLHSKYSETDKTDIKYNTSPIKIERHQTYYGNGSMNQRVSMRNYTDYQGDKNIGHDARYATTNQSIYTSATGSYMQSKQSRRKMSTDADYINSEIRSKQIPNYLKPNQSYGKQYKKAASSFIESSTKPNFTYQYIKGPKQEDKLKQKDEQIKMDQMAKRLNKVLQNISIKSNIIANRTDVISQQPKKQSITNVRTAENKTANYESIVQKKQPPIAYPRSNYTHYVKNILSEKCKQEKPISNIEMNQKNTLKIPEENELKKKYQSMKNSLGVSKHIPSQIILQQSSSEINSQISPRTQFFHLQLKQLFDQLDSNKIGELSKNNCASQLINDQISYMLGAIFNRIKYKDQKMTFKKFLEECQIISKSMGGEMSNILSKRKNNKNEFKLRLNEKEIQSQRWNTINGSQSKRSSGRSQVVKKYEFLQEKVQQKEKINNANQQNHCHKVHWATNDSNSDSKLFSLDNRNKNLTKTPYLNKQQSVLDVKNQNSYSYIPSYNIKDEKSFVITQKKYGQIKQSQKQNNIKSFSIPKKEKVEQRRDFERMCEKLNSKLDNYLTTIKTKQPTGPRISLQFSQLSKHWSVNRS